MKSIYSALLAFFIFAAFQVVEAIEPTRTVMIPMRDGLELSCDLYFPQEKAEKYPCVLVRSPAGRKAFFALSFAALSHHGFVVAIQDTRSAIDPDGKTFPYMSDGWGDLQDGYDTVEWLGNSSFSNGNVGTIGMSALGITQHMLAPTNPPCLKCQYITVAPGSLYHHGLFPGGQLLKNQVEGWLGLYAKDSGVYAYVSQQPFYNDFWADYNIHEVADRIESPGVHFGGWFDTFLQGSIDAFVARQNKGGKGAKGKQKLVIGPWTHYWPKVTTLGDFQVPEKGYAPPVDLSPKRWLDYHLKEIDNGIDEIPSVTYYVMGPFGKESSGHVWRFSDTWPVPSTETAFYLGTDKILKESNTRNSWIFPYSHDPHHPVPTIGGRNLFLESGPKDQRAIEGREDVVVFTSEPFKEDMEVTGQIKAFLYFSSDKHDTDLAIRLTDVYPDGRSILICDGLSRVGFESKEPKEVEVDLWSTSYVFAKGHRMRLIIASSNYPKYECNRNIGHVGCHSGDYEIAKNRIYVGNHSPSRVILPVTRRGNESVSNR